MKTWTLVLAAAWLVSMGGAFLLGRGHVPAHADARLHPERRLSIEVEGFRRTITAHARSAGEGADFSPNLLAIPVDSWGTAYRIKEVQGPAGARWWSIDSAGEDRVFETPGDVEYQFPFP
jgi:hypothetical protein